MSGDFKRFVRGGTVRITTGEGGVVVVTEGARRWTMSLRSFSLLYRHRDGADADADVYAPVARPLWARKVADAGRVGGRTARPGDYTCAWVTPSLATRQAVDAAAAAGALDLFLIDAHVFEAHYVEELDDKPDVAAPTVSPAATPTAASVATAVAGSPSFGVASLQGKRDENEDAHLALPDWDAELALFGVFDGHGGADASAYCVKKLPSLLAARRADLNAADARRAMEDTFVALDRKYLSKRNDDGTTALVAVLHKGSGQLWVANAGDSRALLVRADGAHEQVSVDHKPSLPDEKKRIEGASFKVTVDTLVQHGKRVRVPRVDGKLAVSRAIGDDQFKDEDDDPHTWAVTSVPQLWSGTLGAGDWCVLACDGLWDVCSNYDVAKWIAAQPHPNADDALAQRLAQLAIERGSDDNVSCVVFHRPRAQ